MNADNPKPNPLFADVPYGGAIVAALWALLTLTLYIAQGGGPIAFPLSVGLSPAVIMLIAAKLPGTRLAARLSRAWAVAFWTTVFLLLGGIPAVLFALAAVEVFQHRTLTLMIVAIAAYLVGRASRR